LVLIIQQDRLFDKAAFREKQSATLLARLKSLPPASVAEWADATEQDRDVAAAELINVDAVFQNDAFGEQSFRKLRDERKQANTKQ